jgi:hypothetical protein
LIVEVFQIVRSEHMAAEGDLMLKKYKSAGNSLPVPVSRKKKKKKK